uniref:Uncharacterized protein n=1 Tax=Opuntia streptacantha TaxID=393608 RepID=A0A7C9E6X7_OPUST
MQLDQGLEGILFGPLVVVFASSNVFTISLIFGLFVGSLSVHLKATKKTSYTCSITIGSRNSSWRLTSINLSICSEQFHTDLTHPTKSIPSGNDASTGFFLVSNSSRTTP